MATEAQLRRRIRELQNQLETFSRQQDSFRRDAARQMDDRLARFKSEYDRVLKRQREETEELYAGRLRAFQEQAMQEAGRQYRRLREQAEAIAGRQEEKLAELSESNEELRRLLNEVKSRTDAREAGHCENATAMLAQVEQSRAAADDAPHEYFYNGEYDIINSHASQIRDEIEQGMYQAAAADAGSVIMEFDLLKARVEQALHEWLLAFQDYRMVVRELANKIEALEGQQLQTQAGVFCMGVSELDFWSSGTYLPFRQKVQDALAVVKTIEEQGVTPYLKAQKTADRKSIFASVAEVHKWSDELLGITNCINSERVLSDERWAIGKNAANVLEEAGYARVMKRFRGHGQGSKEVDWRPPNGKFVQNPMDCFDLVETIQGKDRLWIILIPFREHGVAVRNECMIALEAHTLQDRALAEDIVRVNIERMRSIYPGLRVSGIISETGQKQRILLQEQARKKKPSPEGQIRYLERKYH